MILDVANTVMIEPYRACIGYRLVPEQRATGFLTQSAFTGLAQALSYLALSLLVWIGFSRDVVDASGIPDVTGIAVVIGAVLSLATILWSVVCVPNACVALTLSGLPMLLGAAATIIVGRVNLPALNRPGFVGGSNT